MSTADAFWTSIGASGRLVEVSRDECLELLGAMSVAGSVTPPATRVLPVNYVLGATAWSSAPFRTGRSTARAGDHLPVRDRRVFQSGWSVLAVGGL